MADDYSFVGDTSVPHREAAIPAAAKTKNPVRQALVSSTGTFWDTVVICCGESVQGLFLVTVYLGTVVSLDLVWNLADIFNALMAIPNLISLVLLSGVIVRETRKYLWDGDPDRD